MVEFYHHEVAAFDFATVSGCDQLVVGPTHARGGTRDLLGADSLTCIKLSVSQDLSLSCVEAGSLTPTSCSCPNCFVLLQILHEN